MSANDGGPAFPYVCKEAGHYSDGLSLRDYFAAKALTGMLADPAFNKSPEEVANLCYRAADAMLAERAK